MIDEWMIHDSWLYTNLIGIVGVLGKDTKRKENKNIIFI